MVQYRRGLFFEIEREDDGRWLAEVPALPGVLCYGADRDEAVARVQALALRVIAERLEHREAPAEFLNVTFKPLEQLAFDEGAASPGRPAEDRALLALHPSSARAAQRPRPPISRHSSHTAKLYF